MNESSNNKRAVIVGLFVFIGLTFLLAGILMIGNLHETFTRKMRVTSIFEDVNGLLPGSNVWFSGVKIGTVKTVRFFGNSQVEVILNLNSESRQYIRKDANVKIGSDGLIGNKIIIIYGGTAAAPEISEGDTLHVAKTLSTEDIMATLQENNKNILLITNDFKIISKKLANGEGSLGKLLTKDDVYNNIEATTASLQKASERTKELMGSLAAYGVKLNTEGNFANDLVTDTTLFKSIQASVFELQQIADSASVMVSNLKAASSDPNSTLGVLLHDDETGAHLKSTIQNLDSSSATLNEDLEALKYSFLLRGAYKKQAKAKAKTQQQ